MFESNDLTRQILDYLFLQGIYAWRQNSTGLFDPRKGIYRPAAKKGVSDILAIVPPTGRLLAIEVKVGKDRLRPEQEGFLRSVQDMGGLAFVARDFEQTVLFLKGNRLT